MKPIKAVLILSLLALCACKEPLFSQTAYFKDDARNRVFVYKAINTLTAAEVEAHARALTHTERQFTVAYYYAPNGVAPSDFITLAPDYVTANTRMFEGAIGPWLYRAVIDATGRFTFTDCTTNWDEGACR